MTDTHADASEIRTALAAEIHEAVHDATHRVAAVLDPACPSPGFLDALTRELAAAEADPDSVPYPELIDPDRYWSVSVQPQAQSLRDNVALVIEWLEARVVATMEVAENELKRMVDLAVTEAGPNPVADRSELAASLRDRCGELHHQMAELLTVLPDHAPLLAARAAHADGMRRQAMADVDALKPHYLTEAGGDEEHQRFAEQQWSETYAERVAHREAMLAGSAPWRHQELAIVGFERAYGEAETAVEHAVARLQSPLAGLPDLLLERYDDATRY